MKRFLLYSIFFLSLQSLAQHPVSIQLLEKDGLPSNEFYNVIEDDNGFVWLTGDKGITKYDGKNFTTLSHPKKKGLSLFGAKIDDKGRIWCNNIYGQLFYIENDQLYLEADFNLDFKGTLASFDVLGDLIVLSTHNKKMQYHISSKKKISVSTGRISAYTIPIRIDDKIYSGVNDTILEKSFKNNKRYKLNFISSKLETRTNKNSSLLSIRVIPYEKNLLLVNSNELSIGNSLVLWNIKSGKESVIQLPQSLLNIRHINYYFIDRKLWILSDAGIFITRIVNDRLIIDEQLFKGKRISDLLVDRDKNYWITTTENGVYIIPNIYINKIELPEKLESPTDIQIVHDKLFIGTTSSLLYEYDLNNRKGNIVDFNQTKPLKKIFYNRYRDNFVINHESKSLIYDYKNNESTDLPFAINLKDFIFFKDSLALYAVGTKISKFNINHIDRITSQDIFRKEDVIAVTGRGYSVHYDSITDTEYYGTINGLYRSSSNNAMALDTIKTIHGKLLFSKDIDQTINGKIWVSTYTNGVLVVNPKNNIATPLHELIDFNSIRTGIIKADGPVLWITTNDGLFKYDTQINQIQELQKNDGILSYNINNIAIGDHSIYISSDEGVFEVHKTKAFKPKLAPQLFIENIYVNNIKVPTNSPITIKESSSLKLDFLAPGFRSKQRGAFEYKLKGLDDTWTQLDSESRSIQIASMPDGIFHLEIKSTADSDASNSISLPITVTQPFYKSKWTWITIVVIIILIIVFYYKRLLRFRESEKNKQLKQLEINAELINLKLENLRSQMNPHFIFNALNCIQDYIIDNEKELASNFLSKFADLIRTYLNQSIRGNISLKEEINTLHKYLELEKLRFEDKLSVTVNDNGIKNTEEIIIPAMLIQPYVENALKHGLMHIKENRELSIVFELVEIDLVQCTILDNGVGRAAAKKIQARKWGQHQSFATSATKNRLELLNYGASKKAGVEIIDLFDDHKALGTKVILQIPFLRSF